MGFGPTYVAHIPPLRGWYNRDSLCYGVGARVVYLTAKCKKKNTSNLVYPETTNFYIDTIKPYIHPNRLSILFPARLCLLMSYVRYNKAKFWYDVTKE